MRRPAVFFDRDNTLIVGHDYIGDPARVELVAGAPAAIAKCRSMGFAVVVISNQSGVARGMFGEADVHAVNKKLDSLLLASNGGAVIDRHEYCPFHPDAKIDAYRQDSFLRKPKPGMILAAADAMALDLGGSWVVGDAPRDIAAGKAAGCRAILIIDASLTPSPAALEKQAVEADFIVGTLVEAVEIIAQQTNKPAPIKPAPPKAVAAPTSTPPARVEPKPAPPVEAVAALPISTPVTTPVTSPVTSPPAAPPTPATEAPVARPPIRSEQRPDLLSQSVRVDLSRLENVSQQILMELKKLNDIRHDDFSLSKLVAGIVQILAIATVPLAYVMYRSDVATMQAWLLTAVFLQTLTIGTLIMSRQR